MSPDPFYPYNNNPERPATPPAKLTPPSKGWDSPEARAELTDLSIGDYGKPAAHESVCALRMFRAGFTGIQASQTLGVPTGEFRRQFRAGLDQEGEAHHAGRPIWDQKMSKGAK